MGADSGSDSAAFASLTTGLSVFSEVATNDSESLLKRLAGAGIPAGKVRTVDEVYNWEQTRSQHLLIDVEHQTLGTTTLPGSPLRFSRETSGGEIETTKLMHRAPPVLDADADAVMHWLDRATT